MLFAVQTSNAWLATVMNCLVRTVSRDGGLDGKFLRSCPSLYVILVIDAPSTDCKLQGALSPGLRLRRRRRPNVVRDTAR